MPENSEVVPCGICRTTDHVVAASAYTAASDTEIVVDEDRLSPDGVEIFLEKPDEPEAPSVMLWMLAAVIPFVLFFVYWFAPIHRVFKVFLFLWTIAFGVVTFVPELAARQLYPLVGMGLFFFYWVALMLGRRTARAELQAVRIPAYQSQLARWQRLQYCTHCQVAWLEGTPRASVPLVDVPALLEGR